MKEFEGISIRKLEQINTSDKRGPTYEWCKNIPGLQITIYKRKKGSSCGNHFHKGEDKSKNPERFLLLKGSLKLEAKNEINQTMKKEIEPISEILIYPNVLHSFYPLTSIMYLEYRSTVYDRNNEDVYPEEQFNLE